LGGDKFVFLQIKVETKVKMITRIIPEETITRLRLALQKAQDVVVTCHLSPDGDAIGSSLALCSVLRHLGKTAYVVTPDMLPHSLDFVPMSHTIVDFNKREQLARKHIEQADIIFCLDFNSLKRIDKMGEPVAAARAKKILIDHHLNPDVSVFDLMISYPEMSSTCELVYRVLMQMDLLHKLKRDLKACSCLYVGLLTDTGNFTYNCDNLETFEIANKLRKCGIDYKQLYHLALNTFNESALRLQAYAICHKLVLNREKRGALLTLTRKELEEYHYRRGDTEGLVNKPLTIPGIDWCVFMREDPDQIKVSMRSFGNFDVSQLCARHFGGGGHLNAAGGEFHGTMDEAVAIYNQILETIPQQTNEDK